MSDFESSGGSFVSLELLTAQITCAKNNTTVSNHSLSKGGKGTARSAFSKHLLIIMLNQKSTLGLRLVLINIEHGTCLFAQTAINALVGIDYRVLAALGVIFH